MFDISFRCIPCMTLTCLLTWATISLTLHGSCASHVSTLNPRIKARSRLEVSSGYATPHFSPLSAMWRRRRSLPHQASVYSQDALTREIDAPYVILLVAQKRSSQEPNGLMRSQQQEYEIPSSVTWKQSYKNKNGDDVIGWVTPKTQMVRSELNQGNRGIEQRFLQRTLAQVVASSPTPAKLTFKNKKRKKTDEIREALARRYEAGSVGSRDASQVSLLTEEQILDELLDLRNLLRTHPGNPASAQSANGIEESPRHRGNLASAQSANGIEESPRHRGNPARAQSANDMSPRHDQFLLNLAVPLPGHLPPATDLSLDHQPVDTVHHHTMLVDSGHGNLSPSSETSDGPLPPVLVDSFHHLDKHDMSLNQPQSTDRLGHGPHYSSFNEVFQSAPLVSRHQQYQGSGSSTVSGHFLDDTKDCHVISTKTCLADLDCSCSGFYLCADRRCQLVGDVNNPGDKHRLVDDPADKHSWGDDPADKHSWGDGPADKHSWGDGPADNSWGDGPADIQGRANGPGDKHGWGNGPADKHSWGNGPADKHGWGDGLADKHSWRDGPVEFDLVREATATPGTDNQVWHNEPFDFDKTATGADLGQSIDSVVWRQFVNHGFIQPQRDVGELTGVGRSVEDTLWAHSPADLSYWLPRADRTSGWDPEENLLVGELESVK